MDSNPDQVWMTRQQVADLLQIEPMTVYTWGRQGKLTPYKFERIVRYKREEIEALLQPVNGEAKEAE